MFWFSWRHGTFHDVDEGLVDDERDFFAKAHLFEGLIFFVLFTLPNLFEFPEG
jgi:hypothetical protein